MKSLLNSEKADLDNDGKLSSYERKRGEAIEKSMREKKSIGGAIGRALSRAGKKAVGKEPDFTSRLNDPDFFENLDDKALARLRASQGADESTDIATRGFYKSKEAVNDLVDGSRDVNEVRALLEASGFSKKEIDTIISDANKAIENLTDMLDENPDVAIRGMNKGGYVDNEMERLGLAEGTNDENNAKVQNYRVILAGLRKVSEEDRAKAKMLVKEGKALPEEFMIKEEAGVVMNPMDAYKNHPDLFMKALNFLEEPRIEKAEGGEMLNDEDMEENFVEYIIKESLSEEEQNELKEQLEANPKLSELFDEVVIKASEFTGAGSVDGPGTGTSDDIPARLSDGEFVFTAKAVEHIGADNLMKMMKDAEAAHDAGSKREAMQEGGMSSDTEKVEVEYTINRPADTVVSGATPLLAQREQEDMMDEEIKKGMLGVTPYVRS
tara:strand:+ start:226 stop:1542 length:1317 start_codon:yes stop_codon:yes gene_type:complete